MATQVVTTGLAPAPPAAAAATARALPSYPRLHELMRRYQVGNLAGVRPEEFLAELQRFCAIDDATMEGFRDRERQHPIIVKFHWGHRHDFGTFCMPGRMGNHHIAVIATFIDALRALPPSLEGRRVLDIGCWTGGTSLLLCAMGAEVVAVEEARKYAECARYLAKAFGLDRLDVRSTSLYDCTTAEFQDAFDYVLFAGVLHHLSDPRLALRIAFNCLRDGGTCLLETLALHHDPNIQSDRDSGEPLSSWAWNWQLFDPGVLTATLEHVGFAVPDPPAFVDRRTFVAARRRRHVDFWRSGLSNRDVR